MQFVADTHVHLYPCYDIRLSLANLKNGLKAINAQAVHMAFLTERHDCNYFSKLADDDFKDQLSGYSVEKFDNLLRLNGPEGEIYLFAGRQIVTEERIEILSLTSDTVIPDGLPASDVIGKILASGGLPIIPWAPGKWFFSRRKIVEKIIQQNKPGEILLGDTTLRPMLYLKPLLMKRAQKKGFSVLAGSDPLPFSGEELLMGRYVTSFEGEFDPDRPLESARKILQNPETIFNLRGRRSSPLDLFVRLFKNSRSKMEPQRA